MYSTLLQYVTVLFVDIPTSPIAGLTHLEVESWHPARHFPQMTVQGWLGRYFDQGGGGGGGGDGTRGEPELWGLPPYRMNPSQGRWVVP